MEVNNQSPGKEKSIPVYRILQMSSDFDASSNSAKFHVPVISGKGGTREIDDPRPVVTIVDKKKLNRKNRNDTSDADGSRNESSERSFPCTFCHKVFKQNHRLNRHINTHTKEHIYKCHFCEKTFLDSSTLIRHRDIHSGDKPWSCKVCKKSFGTLCSLRRHVTVHNSEGRPIQCETCNKRFSDNSSYQRHKLIHTGIRAHKCDICTKTFVSIGDLNAHRKIHAAVKPYKCQHCGKDFALHKNYVRHLPIHEGKKDFVCQICGVGFNFQSSLTRHIVAHVQQGDKTVLIEEIEEDNPEVTGTVASEGEKKILSKKKSNIPPVSDLVRMKDLKKIDHLQLFQKKDLGKLLSANEDRVTTSTDTVSTVKVVHETIPDNPSVSPLGDGDKFLLDLDDHTLQPRMLELPNSQTINTSDGIKKITYDFVDHNPLPCKDVLEDPTLIPPMDMKIVKEITTENLTRLIAMADDFGSTKDTPQYVYPQIFER